MQRALVGKEVSLSTGRIPFPEDSYCAIGSECASPAPRLRARWFAIAWRVPSATHSIQSPQSVTRAETRIVPMQRPSLAGMPIPGMKTHHFGWEKRGVLVF